MSSVIVAKVSVILAFKFVISGTGVENTLSLTYPHRKKSRGMISGDLGGQGVVLSLPVQLFENVATKNRRTCEPQCGGAPSCWKIIHVMVKKVCIPRSFLVINVCNEGNNLYSPCTKKKFVHIVGLVSRIGRMYIKDWFKPVFPGFLRTL